MNRKNRFFVITVLLLIMLGLSGCQQPTNSTESSGGYTQGRLYYLEFGQMLKSDYLTVVSPYSSKTEFTFDEIKAIRNSLRSCNLIDFQSNANVARNDLHDFFTSHGFTPSETDELFASLDERGNIIGAFNIRNNTNQIVYLYVEKTE